MPVSYEGKRSFTNTISNDANGDATVKLIIKTINTYALSPFVKDTVKILNKGNPSKMEFLKRLFGVACKNVKYLADEPGHEVVYTPLLLMRMGKGDCKKFTVFISSVLKAAGFTPIPKVVKYDNTNDWEHIYVIVKDGDKYITLDPVNKCQFNKEVLYSTARENYLDGTYSKIMNGNKLSVMGNIGTDRKEGSSFMGGIHDSTDRILGDMDGIFGKCRNQSHYDAQALSGIAEDYMNGISDQNMISGSDDMGKRKTKAERKARRKKIFHFLAKTNPAFIPIRVSFLALVKIGGALQKIKGLHINLAKHLAEAMQDPVKAKPLLDLWHKFGGEDKILMKAIIQAGKSSMHGEDNFQSLISGIRGPELAIPAAITAASPLLVAVIKMMKKNGQIKPEQADAIDNAVQTAQDIAVTTKDGKFTPESLQALTSSPLIQSTSKEDNGGNPATSRDIATEAAKENPAFLKEQANDGGASSEQGGRRSAEPSANLPVVQDNTATATGKNMLGSIYLPSVWCRIILLLILIHGAFRMHPVVNTVISSIAVIGLLITSILLFTKKQKYNGKR